MYTLLLQNFNCVLESTCKKLHVKLGQTSHQADCQTIKQTNKQITNIQIKYNKTNETTKLYEQ